MIPVLDLVNLKQTGSVKNWQLGSTIGIVDPTYGPLKATYCYIQDKVTTANCSPAFEDPAAGDWYVDEDEDESGVIGQEYCVGAFLAYPATTAAAYGWVLTAGRNPLAMATSSSGVAAGEFLFATDTNGTWDGTAQAISVAATSGTAYQGLGRIVGLATADDTSNALAAGDAIFHSIWAGFPCVIGAA